jgi:hypothetical protein
MQKDDRASFMIRLKSVETESDSTKGSVDYLRKVIQQHKFLGGCIYTPAFSESNVLSGTG